MMTTDEIMLELKKFGSEQSKKVLTRHGAREPFFGVKVADLKTIVKKTKKNHELSLELYDTGNSDAMYLAGLIADEKMITRDHLNDWAKKAYWYMISDYTVAWISAESPHGWGLAQEWIDSGEEFIASAGWSTLANHCAVTPDEELDKKKLGELLSRVEKTIHNAPNRVRYTMNSFIIALGSYVPDFTEMASETGLKVGKVNVDMGGNSCKVPFASDYIRKVEVRGSIGKKKKIARC
jgi:3-methyladenine DNA glycosylase AlkD